MKIQCNACEMVEARVLCCADEAALCYACDEKVHAANKLAGKHQRVPLTGSASQVPKCDICKEASGFFFCLEDRALLCRKCDTSIHSMNAHVSAHQRFLLTGVKVGADPPEQISISKEQSSPVSGNMEYPSKQPQKRSSSMPSSGETCQTVSDQVVNQTVSDQVNHNANLPSNEISHPGGSISGNTYYWHPEPEEYFDFANFNQNYGFNEHVSSKSDSGKSEGLESSSVYSSSDEELSNGLLVQVPEIPWTVPELPSPPTYSGLSWSKNAHTQLIEDSMFVPDISYSFEDMRQCQRSSPVTKRRRT